MKKRLAQLADVALRIAGAARAIAATVFVDVLGLAGFVAVVAGVFELWGRGWALVVAGGLLLAAYALVEFILPLRLGRRRKRTEA